MIEDLLDENDGKEEKSFASLLDSYSPINGKELQVGDKVQGKIISIGKDTVFVDTNTKVDGVADKQELVDENGQLQYETCSKRQKSKTRKTMQLACK